MDACEGSVMGGDANALVRVAPLLDTLIEQVVREQPACLQTLCSSCRRASAPMKQCHPEGAA
jgi:hypothetical protein